MGKTLALHFLACAPSASPTGPRFTAGGFGLGIGCRRDMPVHARKGGDEKSMSMSISKSKSKSTRRDKGRGGDEGDSE